MSTERTYIFPVLCIALGIQCVHCIFTTQLCAPMKSNCLQEPNPAIRICMIRAARCCHRNKMMDWKIAHHREYSTLFCLNYKNEDHLKWKVLKTATIQAFFMNPYDTLTRKRNALTRLHDILSPANVQMDVVQGWTAGHTMRRNLCAVNPSSKSITTNLTSGTFLSIDWLSVEFINNIQTSCIVLTKAIMTALFALPPISASIIAPKELDKRRAAVWKENCTFIQNSYSCVQRV